MHRRSSTSRVPEIIMWNKKNIVAGRIAAKRQTAGIKFTLWPKINIFAPQGRLVALIHVKFGNAKGHVGPLGRAKFHANRWTGLRGGNAQPPKWQTFPLFGKESPFDRFLQLLGIFLYAQYHALVFYIRDDSLYYGYVVIAEKPRDSHLRRLFSVHTPF